MRQREALSQRKEPAVPHREEAPLFCCKRRDRLKGDPVVANSAVDLLVDVVFVGPVACAHAGGRKIGCVIHREVLDVFAAAEGQLVVFHEPAAIPAVDLRLDVAIAAVHVRWSSRDVPRQLRDREVRDAAERVERDAASAGCGQTLMLGKYHCFGPSAPTSA